MRYLSVCSGIEAASVAWEPLGWTPVAFSQFDPEHNYSRGPDFPSSVLSHHYPSVPNLGDMTKFQEWPDATVDLLVGGTPCQSFSVAGLRKGMADPRGNLALTYLGIADRYRPDWLVWENVPGVLSSNRGRDFGAFLGALVELGYGFAYRVLDAQYVRVDGFGRAVPQRRRRVFVVGHPDWRRAAAVLFERESLCRNPAPRREAGKGVAADVAPSLVRSGRGFDRAGDTRGQDPVVAVARLFGHGFWQEDSVAESMRAKGGDNGGGSETLIAFGGGNTKARGHVEAACLTAKGQRIDFEVETFVAHAFAENSRGELRLEGGDGAVAASLKVGGGKPGQSYPAIAFQTRGSNLDTNGSIAGTVGTNSDRASGGAPCIAFSMRGRDGGAMPEVETASIAPTIRTPGGGSSHVMTASAWVVRRLMPIECERLQGFPDGHTAIVYRGKPAADGPRYRALGNSMAVNVMRWIGRRIQMVNTLDAANDNTETTDARAA